MKILLGDLKLWRKGNIITIFVIFICCSALLYLLHLCRVDYLWLNTLILLMGLVICGIVENSKLFKKTYLTDIAIEKDSITIKNEQAEWRIDRKEIQNIYYREIRYGGRWLEPIGYRLVVETKNHKYHWDSVFKEGEKWENTELFYLYQYLSGKIVVDKRGNC